MEAKARVIFVLGGPGSGKGTHCDLLRQRYNLSHYSVGDILREFLKAGSKQAQHITQLMKEGQMVSSQYVVISIKEKILNGDRSKLILIDGFPRSQGNIEAWNKIVGNEIKVELLMYIDVPDEVMRARLLNRGKTSGRVDDNAEVIEKRLVTFHHQTEPVLVHYKRLYAQGRAKVLNVNGEIKIEVAQNRIHNFFLLNHIA